MIKLTNAHKDFKNNDIVINTKHIVTIHRMMVTREDETKEQVTFVHCPPHGTWEVVETPDEILALIARSA